MKKALITVLFLVACIPAALAQFRWGATAGFNYQKYHFKQDLMRVDASPGFSAGIMGELMFPGIGFGIDFGLNYEMHGSKLHFEDQVIWASEGYGPTQSNIHLIQIPLNLRFKYTKLNGVEQKIAPFVFGGPVFNIQCGHNSVPPLEYSTGSIGLQAQLGAELFRKFQISAGYYWDLTYEARTRKLENLSQHPQGWVLKAVYFFK